MFCVLFRLCEIIYFCFVVPMCDPVHDVVTIHGLCLLSAAIIWKSFLKYD